MAKALIREGKAHVDSQTPEEVKKNRGGRDDDAEGADKNAPGVDSPFRTRSPEENLRLFEEMQAGKYEEGQVEISRKRNLNEMKTACTGTLEEQDYCGR